MWVAHIRQVGTYIVAGMHMLLQTLPGCVCCRTSRYGGVIYIAVARTTCTQEDQSDVYYYLHKKLDDNYDVISALQRQLMVETADREKAEKEYTRQIEELEARRDEELGPLKEKLMTEEEQVF